MRAGGRAGRHGRAAERAGSSRQSTSTVGLPRESRISRAKSSSILNMRAIISARGIALSLTLSVATKNGAKPTITILYDADEDRVRAEALAKKEKFPVLVSVQIEEVLTKRGYTVKRLAAEAPIKKLVRQIEDDNSDLIFNVCESLGGDGGEERRIAAVLELLDKRFTGSGSLSLTLAGDKSLSKKLFEFHGVRSPEFTIISTTGTEGKRRSTSSR